MYRSCLGSHGDVDCGDPCVGFTHRLVDGGISDVADHVVAPSEGHPVEVGVDVVSVGHALGEGRAGSYGVRDHVVADLSVCLRNILILLPYR